MFLLPSDIVVIFNVYRNCIELYLHSVVPACCMEVVSERVGLILDKMSDNTKQATHTGVVIVG